MADLKATQPKEGKVAQAVRAAMTAPYFDLDSSVRVAEAVYNKGGGSCTADQLAHWLEYTSVRSGTFLTRVSSANKHFGLIRQEGDRFVITERAEKILSPVMPEDAVNAKVDAFLAVPLFQRVYEQFRGQQLPPEVGLKNLFLNTYKVLPDRVPIAVRIFLNSATQASLLQTSGDRQRLVRPGGAAVAVPAISPAHPKPPEDAATVVERPAWRSGGGGGDGPVHSAIIGLLRELPPPGSPWSKSKRDQFLLTFDNLIKLLYPAEESSP